jgi:hypothetical protein
MGSINRPESEDNNIIMYYTLKTDSVLGCTSSLTAMFLLCSKPLGVTGLLIY